ncbi:4a-hydroxytetrahydrobiopterin dehydratase [Neiella marina]|uniref:Putative pterin-4-alpha-carbinolamine dehydratase n=1 Tax=Neiella holothuriorum TaxID=2870530 RepID=A0ABS7ECP7_9GAMM|nr:4a-hydroxytetrahydrobiopterin dehydratase [Neiella holothuriorum]MBW8190093.1 4a-hydroxytetrahydrobiopterin dehydratase [Neiella holothuriorum]
MTLAQQVCEACRADAPRVTDAEISEWLPLIAAWQLDAEDGIKKLSRQFKFANFVDAMSFAGHVAELAEAHGHHPALLVEWGKVTVTWWTHKIKGLHKNDFVMAAKTDAIATGLCQ